MKIAARFAASGMASLLLCVTAGAEQGVLVIHVSDTAGKPIRRVVLSTKGDGAVGSPTDVAGRTRIRLSPQTNARAIVALTIVRAPADLVFISPWDQQVRVPPFENESQNFASVVLAERSERALLENGKTLVAIVSRLNLSAAPKETRDADPAARRSEALQETAAAFGLRPDDVDAAIRAWGARTHDAYEKGMAALYAERLDDATDSLASALRLRETALEPQKRDAADAAFFLGRSLYDERKYTLAAAAYRKALSYRPGDAATLNNIGLSLLQSGDYAGAEPFLEQAITAMELARGHTDPDLVPVLDNLATLHIARGKIDVAEPLLRRGLEIREAAYGERDRRVGRSLNNLASLLLLRDNDAAAETVLNRAAQIVPDVAALQLNLSILARHRGDPRRATALAEQALQSLTRQVGPRDPETIRADIVAAHAQLAAQDFDRARRRFGDAVSALELEFGPNHPLLVDALSGLAGSAAAQGNLAQATAAYRRAIAIRQSHFGAEDPIAADLAARLAAVR